MLTPLVGAATWLVIGGLVLWGRSRGEAPHSVASNIALAIVVWAVAGWLVFLGVLGFVGVNAIASSLPWLVESAAMTVLAGSAGWVLGRVGAHDARVHAAPVIGAVVTGFALLLLLLNGPGAAACFGFDSGVMWVAHALGRRAQPQRTFGPA